MASGLDVVFDTMVGIFLFHGDVALQIFLDDSLLQANAITAHESVHPSSSIDRMQRHITI